MVIVPEPSASHSAKVASISSFGTLPRVRPRERTCMRKSPTVIDCHTRRQGHGRRRRTHEQRAWSRSHDKCVGQSRGASRAWVAQCGRYVRGRAGHTHAWLMRMAHKC